MGFHQDDSEMDLAHMCLNRAAGGKEGRPLGAKNDMGCEWDGAGCNTAGFLSSSLAVRLAKGNLSWGFRVKRPHQGETKMEHSAPTQSEVIALEKSYWDAMKAKDGSAASALSGKTSLVTGATGVRAIEKTKMGKMTEDGNWQLQSYAFEDVKVVVPTPDVAIIAYKVKQKVVMDGKSSDLHSADSSTWLRGKAGWECHAHSETYLQPSDS
ncbi:MAG: nuclear transport factor 2 family protein [bacterium]